MTKRRASGSKPRFDRMERVNESVHQVIAERLETLSDPRLELVTVTGVDVTSDLSYATVYFAALGEEHAEDVARGLASATGVLRATVAREVRMRQTPELRFVPDPAIEQGERIESILRSIRETGEGQDPEAQS